MENAAIIGCVSLLLLLGSVKCYYEEADLNPFKLMKEELSKGRPSTWTSFGLDASEEHLPVYVGPQDGVRESDKIEKLPGQPDEGVDFDHYSGYVTVDPKAGRALFYYFVKSLQNSSSKPLVLWLNGGPGCSSLGSGALMELGPFRVNQDGKTLYRNEYAWNREANIIFLESPAGVGFSYSNTTSEYESSGDKRTAQDSYTFLVNWLERFPEYKTRDFYIAGESYAGHYIPQLAQTILHNNKKYKNITTINLKGVAMGNAYIDFETTVRGAVDFFWTHALISDDIYKGLISNCNFSLLNSSSVECKKFVNKANDATGKILYYDIYAPICNSSSDSISVNTFDPCSQNYISSYLNIPRVQEALHANVTALPSPWRPCSGKINGNWTDRPLTVLPIIQELMESGLRVWMYSPKAFGNNVVVTSGGNGIDDFNMNMCICSGDTDGAIPVTSTRYSINKLGTPIKTPWYPWYTQGEVGGYAVGYQNLAFMTIRGSGHFVPSYQPARAMLLFSSFINGKLPPPA